jgi:hypothetical protein
MYRQAILPGMSGWGTAPSPEECTPVERVERNLREMSRGFNNPSFATNMPNGYVIPPYIHAKKGILDNHDRIFENHESISFAIPGGIVYAGPTGFKIVTD